MLRIAIQRDTGHTVERSFLGHVARVGNDAAGVGGEESKLQVVQRFGKAQRLQRSLGGYLLHRLPGSTTQGCNHGNTSLCGIGIENAQHGFQSLSVGNEQLAVERQHKVGSVRDGGQGRVLGQLVADAFDTLTTEAEVVDEDVAHHIDFRQLCSLTIGNTIIADACGEEQV